MDERLRFLLYGTHDGFSRSTLGDDNILLVLDNGDKVEIPNHFVKNASDFVEKNQIKLKDVIARIKQLDIGARKVWIDEILNELGSDYGLLKYKAGYEQGNVEGLIEPQKQVVKQFVADWYEKNKNNLDYNIWNFIYEWEDQEESEFKNWFNRSNRAFQTLVNMHQFGYEVEKEPKYIVKMKNIHSYSSTLKRDGITGEYFFGNETQMCASLSTHTRKELEEEGFGEVFNSPLFEVEEVEG